MKRLIVIAILLLGMIPRTFAQTGTWSGKLDVQGTALSIVFHLDGENPTADSPDQGARGIPIQIERKEMGGIVIRIPSLGASFEGQWLVKQIVGTFRQLGLSLPLTLTPGEPKLNRPQTPQGPFPYAEEEVSFVNGDAVLQGTLVLPEGCTRKTPVLIMVTGSGQQNRDEEIFEHKPFAVIADALARAGFATLRYDDRGVGGSTGDVLDSTTEDFKNDALAGIKLLRERFDKVGVIGHSEGGTIALMLAAEGQADFIVSLAGMAISGKETLLWQYRLRLKQAGIPEENIDDYAEAAMKQDQSPWMKYFQTIDVRPLLGRITCPVLALNGTLDMQVEHEANLGALRAGLPANPRTRIEALEGLNHLFQHSRTGDVTEYRSIEETFAPEAIEIMVQWLDEIH